MVWSAPNETLPGEFPVTGRASRRVPDLWALDLRGRPAPMAERRVDVVVIGGAYAGASTALLLRRECPELSVLIVERAAAFDMKVGEATTEISAMFLTRRLAQSEHLEREQLPKEGLRFWFSSDRVRSRADASEAGGALRSALPSFQLRRDALDAHLLATAGAEAPRCGGPRG